MEQKNNNLFLLPQASGEAQYINDIPKMQHEVFGAFVTSQQAAAQLESIDTTEAMVGWNNQKRFLFDDHSWVT